MCQIKPYALLEMTSVLNHGGLNYQLGNPIRVELGNLRRALTELRAEYDTGKNDNTSQKNDVYALKTEMKNLNRLVYATRNSLTGISQQITAIQNALQTLAQQANVTLPPFPVVQPTPVALPAPAEEEDEYEEEAAPAPAPVPAPAPAQRGRMRRSMQ